MLCYLSRNYAVQGGYSYFFFRFSIEIYTFLTILIIFQNCSAFSFHKFDKWTSKEGSFNSLSLSFRSRKTLKNNLKWTDSAQLFHLNLFNQKWFKLNLHHPNRTIAVGDVNSFEASFPGGGKEGKSVPFLQGTWLETQFSWGDDPFERYRKTWPDVSNTNC